MRRILVGRPELKYYEAGLDLGLSTDPYESFRRFQDLIRHEYDTMVDEFGLIRIDATQTLVAQQQQMRDIVRPHLDGAMRAPETTRATRCAWSVCSAITWPNRASRCRNA